MSAAPEKIRLDPEHPYPGPSSFDEEHAAFFHGRAREADELFAIVELRPLAVLYGKSGLGKTSLLSAGLFPRMRRAGLVPIRVRLGFGVDERGQRHPALVEQVQKRLREAIDRGELDGAPPREGESLWEYFHWTGFWDGGGRPVLPVIVLDQFEEVFTLGRDRAEELRALVRELADLVENRIPASLRGAAQAGTAKLPPSFDALGAKVLIALREDFLAQLDDFRPQMPSLAAGRYRLRPLGGRAARDAVLEPGRAIVTLDVAESIVKKLGNVEAGAPLDLVEEVEPALLALYCHELNALRDRNHLPKIDAALLAAGEKDILDQFYERCLRGMPDPVRLLVEEKLLTPDNRRDTIAIGRAFDEGASEADVQKLVDRRLLRKEPRLGHEYVEIVHDKLVSTIAGRRDDRRRREKEARALREREAQDREHRAREEEQQRRREEALREKAEEEKQRAEAEKLRAEAEKLRADAERLRVEEAERRGQLAEKLAQARKRQNAILWVLVGVLALAAIGAQAYRTWNAAQTEALKKTADARARIDNNDARVRELTGLAWRAAADQRWDDVARMLAPAFRAVDESRKLHASLAPDPDPRSPGAPVPAETPLLALLASRFEATAFGIATVPGDPSGIDALTVTRDGRVGVALGTDGRGVKLIDLAGQRPVTDADPPGGAGGAPGKELKPNEIEPTDTFTGAIRTLVPSADGSTLFGQGDKGQLVVWRMADGRRRLGLRAGLPRARLAVDRAGRRAVLWDGDAEKALVLTIDAEAGRADGPVEIALKRTRGKAPGAGRWAYTGDWSALLPTPDGRRVVGLWEETWLRVDGNRDRRVEAEIVVWDAATGAVIARAPHEGHLSAPQLADDGAALAALSEEGDVLLFRLGEARVDPLPPLPQRLPQNGWIAFDGARLMTGTESGLGIWDIASPEAPKQLVSLTIGTAPRRAALTPDAGGALVWVDDEVRLYDLKLGQPRAAVMLPDAERRGPGGVQLRAGGDAPRIVTAREDGVRVRTFGAGALDRYLSGSAADAKAIFSTLVPRAGVVEQVEGDGTGIAILADGAVSVVRALDDARLDVSAWSKPSASLVRAARLRGGRVTALHGDGSFRFGDAVRRPKDSAGWGPLLALSDDGSCAVTAGRGSRLYVWDDSGQVAWVADARQKDSVSPRAGDDVAVTAVAITTDGPDRPRVIAGDVKGGVRAILTGGAPGKRVEWTTEPFDTSPHGGAVRAIEIGPGGRIATGADDGSVALWDRDGHLARPRDAAPKHAGAVRVLRFADEGRALVSGGADHAVHVWRTDGSGHACTLADHGDEIVAIDVERGPNPHAASVDAGGTAIVWSLATCKPLRRLQGMAYAGFLAAARDRVVTVRRTGRVELWPAEARNADAPPETPRGTAAWGVFLGAGALVTGDEEGALFEWKLDAAGAAPARLAGEIGGVPAVASAGGRAVAVTPEGAVRAWAGDAMTGGFVGRIRLDRGWAVRAAALSSDGEKLFTLEEGPDAALRGRTFPWRKWDAPGPAVDLRGSTRCEVSAEGGAGRVFAAATTRAGVRAIVVEGSGCVRVWDDGGKLRVEGLGPSGSDSAASRVAAAALGPGDDRLVIAGADGAVSTWAIEADDAGGPGKLHRLALERRRHVQRVRAIAFHPEGRFVVTAGDDDAAWLWDTLDGRALARLGAHPAPIHWAAFRPDGAMAITGGADGWIRAFSTRTADDDPQHVLHVLGAWLPEVTAADAPHP